MNKALFLLPAFFITPLLGCAAKTFTFKFTGEHCHLKNHQGGTYEQQVDVNKSISFTVIPDDGYGFLVYYPDLPTGVHFNDDVLTIDKMDQDYTINLEAYEGMCKVTFDVNGGTDGPSVRYAKRGETLSEPNEPTPPDDYCIFAGWYLNDTLFNFDETEITGPINLVAHYNYHEMVHITFDAGEGHRTEMTDEQSYSIDVLKGTRWTNLPDHATGGISEDRYSDFKCWLLNDKPVSNSYRLVDNNVTFRADYYAPGGIGQLTFTPRENNATLKIDKGNLDLQYLLEGWDIESGWKPAPSSITVNLGQRIYLKGHNPDGIKRSIFHDTKSPFAIGGYADALINESSLPVPIPDEAFHYLFADTSLNNAPNIVSAYNLFIFIVTKKIYASAFRNSFNLVRGPKIMPNEATTSLENDCFNSMFSNCTSLCFAPDLPNTQLADGCYHDMFNGCTSLIKGPNSLPAITLKKDCYRSMFYGCVSLKKAPIIAATNLVERSCNHMFYNCDIDYEVKTEPSTGTLIFHCETREDEEMAKEMFTGYTPEVGDYIYEKAS